ncbi:arylesterase [Arcticibacterium luteifluviistationis]|uniref:Arylesterase n=1 Tax=Arcticibacterium luteifluviistationis TaxID=1784714 RepID=A0A2Z4G8G4_9BACT|nr:arylesterase [Arcticibacterium luteifluviistationis]AWV97436.1 arylesterase [Arcticibacterium luteifluviistationis]
MNKLIPIFLVLILAACTSETKEETGTQTENTSKPENNSKTILFFGNSLTAGYGVGLEEAFPAKIQNKLDSLEMDYTVVNAGLSGETTSGGLNRLDWVLNQKVDVFVLELGANDGLRGIPLKETKANLQAIIDLVWEKNPDTKIILAGMQIPPNMGQDYTTEFKNIWTDLAKTNDVKLIPFLLDGVGGVPSLNQGDGIHPTIEGHKILAKNVWEVLEGVI